MYLQVNTAHWNCFNFYIISRANALSGVFLQSFCECVCVCDSRVKRNKSSKVILDVCLFTCENALHIFVPLGNISRSECGPIENEKTLLAFITNDAVDRITHCECNLKCSWVRFHAVHIHKFSIFPHTHNLHMLHAAVKRQRYAFLRYPA